MSDDRKDLPAVSSDNFLQRVREALQTYMGSQGNVLDRGVTLRDLSDTGLIDLSKSYLTTRRGSPVAGPGPAAGGATPVPDLTPPPTPTGFTVGAGISHLFIGCAPPTYSQGHGHLVTRLYGATWTTGDLPVFADATVLTEFQGTVFAHPTNPATTWHLWITWVTRDGVESAVA
ncbi:MAG: phage-related protein tail component-like protein, partial [uncultured bacterium]